MVFLKKNWGNLVILLVLILLFVPQTGTPIRVFIQRQFAGSPSEIKELELETLTDYNWELQNIDGGNTNLIESEGRVIIINHWATWCPPCIAEMPSFQKLYADYGARVDFYFVSSEDKDKLQSFMVKNSYDLPIYNDLAVAPKQLQTEVLPKTFVISKSRKFVIDESGAADWNSEKTRKLLDRLISE